MKAPEKPRRERELACLRWTPQTGHFLLHGNAQFPFGIRVRVGLGPKISTYSWKILEI
jgi:hypothetical protein